MSGPGGGVAGMVDGSFFKTPKWVDQEKAPGRTPQTPARWGPLLSKILSGQGLIFSPNLIWLTIAALDYVVFPYDFDKATTLQRDWILERALINVGIIGCYYSFWHGTTYLVAWSTRKFSADTRPSALNMAHNIWYTTLGALQWTAWEVLFVHMWATGKLGYVSDQEVISSPRAALATLAWLVAIPVWRGAHFYFAHRFIHIGALYKFVHSLHHRNGDIEPFAGMAMHPVEHLYYFSCLAPSVWFAAHPIVMLFNGIHLVLSPACSHSGFEDHVQSDQFHYLHHAKFECNYGSASLPLDHWFGTFREKLGDSKLYRGDAKGETKASPFKIQSSIWFEVYFWCSIALFACFLLAAGGEPTLAARPYAVAAGLAFGPLVLGACLYELSGDKQSPRWPFHKEPWLGGLHKSFGFNAAVGFSVGVLPVYHFATALLATCAACA
eukprot:CAMPEP_0206285448 /NCGR_PEP_ID=MMETSP0106_2-20121207/103_1 /ASSEMBLY_ACC=CAM_ASM_000206 /TAXON_ID=81532 /ORGANISM="Acanthoeca-like sp., Strain 10tr" /LENGTH=438 /DNA_ID=CAMNT_0053715965 /DNA_START=24 /DNA_END=1340 /DNA_ORIENTATION=+